MQARETPGITWEGTVHLVRQGTTAVVVILPPDAFEAVLDAACAA